MIVKIERLIRHKPIITIILGLVLISFYIAFPQYVIATKSMDPTMPPGSYVVSFRFAYLFSEPSSKDIVIFEPVEGISKYDWTHRVISTAGETVLIRTDKGRNDTDDRFEALADGATVDVPEGYVYQSGDAKSSFHGFANVGLIKGKVLFHFMPFWSKK